MKVDLNNIDTLPIHRNEYNLLKALLLDLKDINKVDSNLYIDWQDYHNEYSPERTDPCPDYYGYYTVKRVPTDSIGIEMTIDELDVVLCTLYDYILNDEKELES